MEYDGTSSGKSWKPQPIQDQRSHCRVASGCQMNSLESSFLEPSQVTSHQTLPDSLGFRLRGELPDTGLHMFSLMFIILYIYIILYNCIWRTSIEKNMLYLSVYVIDVAFWCSTQDHRILRDISWTATWSKRCWSSHSPNLRASNWWKFPETSHALSKMSHMQVGPHAQIPWFGSQ